MPNLLLVCLLAVFSWSMSLASLPAQQVVVHETVIDGVKVVEQIEVDVADAPATADADAAPAAVKAGGEATVDAIIQRGQAKWKYWDSLEDPAQQWTELDFDDSPWKEGQAPLGYGDNFIKTKISFGDDDQQKHRVAFFRHKFQVTKEAASVPAVAKIRMDDAAIVYVNAKEVYRFNLPDGPVDDRTLASVSLKPENRDWTFVVDTEHLKPGENIVAVRVHQRSDSSSDLLLDLGLKSIDEPAAKVARAAQANEKKDLAAGTTQKAKSHALVSLKSKGWKYWDKENPPQGEWSALDYDDAQWGTGTAPLGYGDSHIKTEISYGKDQRNKRPVAFFRRKFHIAEEAVTAAVVGKMLADDGAVVYVNGKEVFRQNLPAGPLDENTRTKNAISAPEEDHHWTFVVDNDHLVIGENILAVRIHQCNAISSDLSLDVELKSVGSNVVTLALAVQNKEALGEAVFAGAAAVVVARPVNRQMYHLSDGEMTYIDQNGTQQTMIQDAIQQAKSYSPQARFARALDGDTLEKLAAMYDVPVEKLRLLNRQRVGKALQHREIYCLGWKYVVRENDSLASLAKRYNSTASLIAKLNDLETTAELKPGQSIQVPGEFKYMVGNNGRQTYLQLGVYQQRNVARATPYDPKSQKIDIHTLRQGEELADVAKAKGVTEDFLKTMNGLADDDELPTGRRILVKYSVRPKDDATLNDIAQFFNIDFDELLEVNQLAKADDLKPGEHIEIPMGERMNLGVPQPQNQNTGDEIFEVVLGDAVAVKQVFENNAGENN